MGDKSKRTIKVRLEESETLMRKIRKDDPVNLAIPTWDLISEAIKEGRPDEALELLDYVRVVESQMNNDSFVSLAEMLLTHLANLGEEEIEKILRQRYKPRMAEFLATTHGVEEVLQRCTESQRRHHANFTVTEEPDKYVVRYDPCGSGGRLRRTREVGTTKKAYPWSWGRVGVPYYCCHCCINWEISATELQGYPAKITLVGDRPGDPCVHLFYKNPVLIPEEYFTRIGKKKDKARLESA